VYSLIRPLRTDLRSSRPVVEVGHGNARSITIVVGDVLRDALVRPGRVVVRLIFGQDGPQMRRAQDQHPVECLSAQGAD